MAYCALSPVSAAVYSALNVAALTALAPGGVYDDVPQNPTFPFVLFELDERNVGGFGTKALPEIDLRVHVYSQYRGFKEAQAIASKAIELLRYTTPSVTGYNGTWLVVHDETIPLRDELLNGVKCKELVARFRLYVEEP